MYISDNNKSMFKIFDKIRLYNYQGIYHRQGNRIAVPRVGYSRLNRGNGNTVSVRLLHILSFNPNCIGGGGQIYPRFFINQNKYTFDRSYHSVFLTPF